MGRRVDEPLERDEVVRSETISIKSERPPPPDRRGALMPIDPNAIGARTDSKPFEWTDRETLLYALGVGCGTADLAFTTENSHDIPQQVLPTYAVIACPAWGAAAKVGSFNWAMLLHGSQQIRLHAPLPPAGRLNVSSEVIDIQDKGEGKNAILVLKGTGTDDDGNVIAESVSTAVIRGEGGFGGAARRAPRRPADPRPRAGRHRGAADHRGPAADLPALRRPQPAAQRPVVRPDPGRFPEADPARAVHLRCRGPRPGRRARRRGRRQDHRDRRAVHVTGVSR